MKTDKNCRRDQRGAAPAGGATRWRTTGLRSQRFRSRRGVLNLLAGGSARAPCSDRGTNLHGFAFLVARERRVNHHPLYGSERIKFTKSHRWESDPRHGGPSEDSGRPSKSLTHREPSLSHRRHGASASRFEAVKRVARCAAAEHRARRCACATPGAAAQEPVDGIALGKRELLCATRAGSRTTAKRHFGFCWRYRK